MKSKHTLLYLVLCTLIYSCSSNPQEEEEWLQLFNGVDLRDWTPKFAGFPVGENFNNTFVVEDSLLKVSYADYDTFRNEFGHLFYKEPFESYKLRVEYQFYGDQVNGGAPWAFRNNGMMLHCQTAESMLIDQGFPVSLEAQLLGGNGTDPRSNGNLCTPGMHVKLGDKLVTKHCIPSNSKTYHGDQWVTLEILVNPGGSFYHILEGDTVITYHSPVIGGTFLPENYSVKEGTSVNSGYISIQAESHPIAFRKIELMKQ